MKKPHVLNRPMFNKGGTSAYGRGIASNLVTDEQRVRYNTGGRVGLQEGSNWKFSETGLGKTIGGIGDALWYQIPGALADPFNLASNKLVEWTTGYNPGLSARKGIRRQKDELFGVDRANRMTDEDVNKNILFGMEFDATEGWRIPSMKKEIEKKDDKPNDLPSVKKVLTDAEKKLIEDIKLKNAKAAKDKRVNDLLEIMNYDKSRKNAAYDALIDASEVIRETGFKDESILPIVKATSARFDKPEQIKEAVGLMMAKGEIEKDIAAGKGGTLKQNAKDLYNAGVFKSEKEALEHLSQAKSMREKAVDWAARQKKVIDQTTVIDVMADEYGIRPTVLTSEDEMEKEQKKDTYVDDLTVFKRIKKVKKLDPGYYVIGRAGFIINSDGTIKQVLG